MTMRPDEYHNPTGNDTRRGGRFELFFFEQIGSRSYLRFTRLALLLVVCLTVIPMVAICALFFTQSRVDLKNVNIDIRAQPGAPANYGGPIVMPPPTTMPAPPKAGRSQRGGEPARQTPAAPGSNANAPATPSPTPSTRPPRPPG